MSSPPVLPSQDMVAEVRASCRRVCCADPEAADFVLSQAAKTRIVGLDITHSCTFTGDELKGLHGRGRFGTFLSSITAFYLKYHRYGSKDLALPSCS